MDLKDSVETEFVVKEDGIYQLRISLSKERLKDVIDEFNRFGGRSAFSSLVAGKFADEYARRNYDTLTKLIDMDLVKLIATRKLAGVVASEGD